MEPLPGYFSCVALSADITVLAALLLMLYRARLSAGLWVPFAVLLCGWFVSAFYAGARHAYAGHGHRFPLIAVQILAPIVAAYVLVIAIPALRRAVQAIPPASLVGIQAVRIVGALFLAALALDQLPAAFALPAGIGDVIVGLSAIPLAFALARNAPQARRWALAWNVFGLLDLLVAVATGFLSSSNPFRLIYENPPADQLSALPLVMIPAFGVPLFALLHFASLQSLRPRVELSRRDVAFETGVSETAAAAICASSSRKPLKLSGGRIFAHAPAQPVFSDHQSETDRSIGDA
jgi:hypothetical protein